MPQAHVRGDAKPERQRWFHAARRPRRDPAWTPIPGRRQPPRQPCRVTGTRNSHCHDKRRSQGIVAAWLKSGWARSARTSGPRNGKIPHVRTLGSNQQRHLRSGKGFCKYCRPLRAKPRVSTVSPSAQQGAGWMATGAPGAWPDAQSPRVVQGPCKRGGCSLTGGGVVANIRPSSKGGR